MQNYPACILSFFVGSIIMDGAAGTGDNAGGGSGGSIHIKVPLLRGNGKITANGGRGAGLGGGGAGGRIFMDLDS